MLPHEMRNSVDRTLQIANNLSMSTTKAADPGMIPPDVLADGEAIIEAVMAGRKPDPEVARRVHARAEKVRRQIFEQHGLLDIGVPAIRELRDS
jgi:hypothetical protein